MKRIISFTAFFALLFLLFQFVVIYFNTGHEVTYSFQSEEEVYEITERLFISENEPVYQFTIKSGDNTFLVENRTNYNKQKKIISNILNYKQDGFECIVPIYFDSTEDIHDPVCVKDNVEYTYTYLKDSYPSLNIIQTDLTSKNMILPSWNNNQETSVYRLITVYQQNIPKQFYVGIWKYQGIDVFSNESETYTGLLTADSYQKKGILVNQNYIIPEYNTTSEFDSFAITNISSFGKRVMTIDFRISNDSYYNGVVDDKVYLFDRTNMKQYEINPSTQIIREIGNTEINAQYYNGTIWQDRNIYDFVNQEIKFGRDYSQIVELQSYSPKEIVETDDSYYLIDANSQLYRFYKSDLSKPVLLCQMANMKELKVVHDHAYFLVNDTLYVYNDMTGLLPIAINNEFIYNSSNMYEVYYK